MKIALEVFDDLMLEKFQIHILEPIIKPKVIFKIRPIIRKEFSDK